MSLRELSSRLKNWRAERPDEWMMDEFIRLAQALEYKSERDDEDLASLSARVAELESAVKESLTTGGQPAVDDVVLPDGWELAATKDGGIIVQHKTLGGCFVTEKENEPREIPGQILFYLASDILAAQRQKAGGAE